MFKGLKAKIERLYRPKFLEALGASGKIIVVSAVVGCAIAAFDLGITRIVELFI